MLLCPPRGPIGVSKTIPSQLYQTIPHPLSLYTQCIKSPFSPKKPVLYAIVPLLGVKNGKKIGIMLNTAVNAVDVIPKNPIMKAPDVVYLHTY